ncbi:hypothetical protein CVT26_009725, partial [Gymnopilus dilepis]
MTYVVGQAFNAFSDFSMQPSASSLTPSSAPSKEARDALYRGVGLAALELVGLAVGSFALGSLSSSLWIWVGEINTRMVRRRVYDAVMGKEMAWFDLHVGSGGEETQEGEGGDNQGTSVGAGGLMAKFSRETDDIRAASSLALGQLLQYLTTALTALLLAFSRSYSLTLIILASIPLLILTQGLAQSLSSPLLHLEREQTAQAASTLERALVHLGSVKSYNAQNYFLSLTTSSFASLQRTARRLNTLWGATSAAAQFLMMALFVQAFWWGA